MEAKGGLQDWPRITDEAAIIHGHRAVAVSWKPRIGQQRSVNSTVRFSPEADTEK